MATSSTYIYPVSPVKITQGFGANPEYYAQYGQKGHNGIDLAVALNAPVRAARDGVVKFSGNGAELPYVGSIAGNYVLINHGDMWTGYAHNNINKVKTGQVVKQGDIIALAGKTGDASGVHVHFEFIAPANPVTNANGYWGRVNPSNFVIKEQDMVTASQASHLYRMYVQQPTSDWGKENMVGKMTWGQAVKHLKESKKYAELITQAKGGTLQAQKHLPTELMANYTSTSVVLKPGRYEVK